MDGGRWRGKKEERFGKRGERFGRKIHSAVGKESLELFLVVAFHSITY